MAMELQSQTGSLKLNNRTYIYCLLARLYSPSTEPSPVLPGWDNEAAPPNLRTSFDRVAGGQSQMDRSNSLRGKLGLEPRSSRASSQSATPPEISPRMSQHGGSDDDFGFTPARFQDSVMEPKQSVRDLSCVAFRG